MPKILSLILIIKVICFYYNVCMKRSLVEQVQFIIHMKGCTEDI